MEEMEGAKFSDFYKKNSELGNFVYRIEPRAGILIFFP
jgi:hypothetical protein